MAARWGTRQFAGGAAVAAPLEVAGCAAAQKVGSPAQESGAMATSEVPAGTLWVTDRERRVATILDARNGEVLAAIDVGESPIELANPNGTDKVYVSSDAADEVAVLGYAGAWPHGVLFLPAD